MIKITVDQCVDITNHIVRQHHENKNLHLSSDELDCFSAMAHKFCNHVGSLTDYTNGSSRKHEIMCCSIIDGRMTYSQKEIYNYPITIAQFSVLFYRLLKTYEEDFYWCEKKSEDKLALDAMATIL